MSILDRTQKRAELADSIIFLSTFIKKVALYNAAILAINHLVGPLWALLLFVFYFPLHLWAENYSLANCTEERAL